VKFGVKRGGLKKFGEMLMEVLEIEKERKREDVSSRMKKKKHNHGQKTLTTAWADSPQAVVLTTGSP